MLASIRAIAVFTLALSCGLISPVRGQSVRLAPQASVDTVPAAFASTAALEAELADLRSRMDALDQAAASKVDHKSLGGQICPGWLVSVDYLNWDLRQRGTDFAIATNAQADAVGSGSVHNLDMDRNSGVRMNLGYRTISGWEWGLGYTYFQTDGTASAAAPAGGNHRPVAVFTLHTIDGDGGDWCAISAFENFEWTPAVASDGRILYARWDYIDRFNGHFFSLWSKNPDGTNPQLVYGNYTVRPQCVFQARPIPGSHQLIFTATGHHSITGGSLALLDRTRGTEFERPLTRLTPEVCFPETEGWPKSYYVDPWPLSEQFFLTAWSDRPLPPHTLMKPDDPRNPPNACGIYLYDAFGNLTLLHRDPAISTVWPVPVAPRPKPRTIPDAVDWAGRQEGAFLVQDVYQGMDGVPRGTIQSLRIIGVPPKVQPHMNNPNLGVSAEDPGKFVLGTAPVESDGSALFRVPSGIPVLFQALDADGLAVQTMRSLSYVQPGQTLACVGCHEHRDSAPLPARMPLAALRDASPLTPDPDGSWPLRFDQLVQPVLDRHCVSCHKRGVENAVAAAFDLTPAAAYKNLLEYADGDLRKLAFERDRSFVGQIPAA
jgi:hypothetical protein